ncbi:G/T mismatch-specific thymine DNA glycosylase [Grifola frondosa]|uniref:G/T mismatch-specific thymine DNA glycosylase n=1 Tax=Grifola frondosa TaxID=5627 RepID=A0A1C7M4E9_GRIFR|nr:G/T mismatch-specific thymine DNA glycosylase [Grifola frondosa]
MEQSPKSVEDLKVKLSSFAFSPTNNPRPGSSTAQTSQLQQHTTETSPILRRSPRKHTPSERAVKLEDTDVGEFSDHDSNSTPRIPRKRSSSTAFDSDIRQPTAKKLKTKTKTKTKRGIAPPEKYAHLNPIHDCLKEGLDILFCGINPGQVSAKVGHHFAGPTNHFWRCLAQSNLTDRVLLPSEDFTLPDAYNLGVTNLVDKPTAEQAEIHPSDFTAGVPVLLRKIARFHPRIVCFVGKGIWESFRRAIIPSVIPAEIDKDETERDINPRPSSSKGKQRALKSKGGKSATVPFEWDIQPFKFVHPVLPTTDVRETLFFVTPSTSGRVVSHQLPQKVVLFSLLKQRVKDLKEGRIDTSMMGTIPPPT